MNAGCNVKVINPKDLTQKQFIRLGEVSQDLWAHGIGEFVQCNCCSKMMSKQDIFGHLEKVVYDNTVKRIMDLLEIREIQCTDCGGQTDFVYGEGHVENIRERLLRRPSHLVVAEDHAGEIVGYMDGYTDSLEGIFSREYYSHYKEIGVGEISLRVQKALGYVPDKMLGYSGVGLIETHSNFFNIFSLLKQFYQTVETISPDTPAITELDRNNNFHAIFNAMGYESLEIHNEPDLARKITNIGKNYNSELVVFRSPIDGYRKKFLDLGIKSFLKMFPSCIPSRKQTAEV